MKLLAALLWAWAAPAAAQLAVTAQVNKSVVALDDQVVLAVTVTGPQASLPDPKLPALANFSVYSSGRSQSISIVNGRMSGNTTHTFVLVPRAVGKGLVPPITVAQDGAAAQTEPIELQVVPPGARGQATPARPGPGPGRAPEGRAGQAPDVFLTAELDRPRAYVNEQVTLSVKFYTAVPLLSNPEYTAPKLSGFLPEDLPPRPGMRVQHLGRTYEMTQIKTALFPLTPGRLSISPARVRCQVQRAGDADPFASDFFERFFSQGLASGQAVELRSDPLTLQVEALPALGKPADFSGAVGAFTMTMSADKAKTKVGEAVNLSVTVAGRGNVKTLGGLTLPELPAWRFYEPVASVDLEKKDDLVQGSKTYRVVAVPRVSGELTLPPFSLSFFDPAARAYARAQTKPLTVTVSPGAGPAPGPFTSTSVAAPATPRGLTLVAEDIRYLKAAKGRAPLSSALAAVAASRPAHAAPFIFFLLCAAAAWRRRRLELDPKGARLRAAARTALSRSALAARQKDEHKAAAALAEALSGYAADKLGAPVSGLTWRRVQDAMSRGALKPELIERTGALWAELDARRFAPAGLAGRAAPALASDLAALIKELEAAWR